MNFLGHAAAARWYSGEPRFVLGAMLPDFAHMAGIRAVRPGDAVTAAGVAFHHRTDAAFHGCASFHALCHAGTTRLRADGVARGPALALGHVAIELLLDGVLADDRELVADYRAALVVELELDPSHAPGIDRVRTRLAEAGAPRWYLDLDELVPRLERILAGHARLALAASDRAPLHAWLLDARPSVLAQAPTLLAELRARIATS
jgi:hypothetical protein